MSIKSECDAFVVCKGRVEELEAAIKEARRELRERETSIVNLAKKRHLETKGTVVLDDRVLVRIKAGRTNVAWKEEFIARLGEETATSVLEATPRSTTIVVECL